MTPTDIAWDKLDGPDAYIPAKVEAALQMMTEASTESSARNAYNEVLSAIGNNHAGTLYPAAVMAMPIVLELANSDLVWPRWSAREVISECLTSSRPEPGFETATMPDGTTCNVAAAIEGQICGAGFA